jgi:hypothetical protein
MSVFCVGLVFVGFCIDVREHCCIFENVFGFCLNLGINVWIDTRIVCIAQTRALYCCTHCLDLYTQCLYVYIFVYVCFFMSPRASGV